MLTLFTAVNYVLANLRHMNIQNVILWLECRNGDVCAAGHCHRQ